MPAIVKAARWNARLVLLAALLLTALAASGPLLAAPAQAPGSRIVVDLPAGFSVSSSFSGFVHAPSGASIILLEVPASAYPAMVSGLTPETLSGRGLTNAKTGRLDRQGDYHYITAEQPVAAGTYAKYILVFREGHVTALISASVPNEALESGSIKPADFERILASARLSPEAVTAAKPYVLGYTGPFRDTGAFVGQTYFYSISGRPPLPNGTDGTPPTLIVSASLDGQPIEDLEAAGRAGMAALGAGRKLQDVETQRITVAGLDGIEQMARPSDSGAAHDGGIYQVILRGKQGGYYRIVGTAPAAEWPILLPQFRRIALSLSPCP